MALIFFTTLVHGFGHPWSIPQSTQKLHRMLSYFADYEYILQRLCWVGWRAENQWLSTKYLSIQSGFWVVWGVPIMCLNSQQHLVKKLEPRTNFFEITKLGTNIQPWQFPICVFLRITYFKYSWAIFHFDQFIICAKFYDQLKM